jgi:hypothetical protein
MTGLFESGIAMLWIEAIINLSAFAGFIGLANRRSNEQAD